MLLLYVGPAYWPFSGAGPSSPSTVASGMSVSTRRCSRRFLKPDPKSPHGRTTTTETDPTHPWAISRPTNSHQKRHCKHRQHEVKNQPKDSALNRMRNGSQVTITPFTACLPNGKACQPSLKKDLRSSTMIEFLKTKVRHRAFVSTAEQNQANGRLKVGHLRRLCQRNHKRKLLQIRGCPQMTMPTGMVLSSNFP